MVVQGDSTADPPRAHSKRRQDIVLVDQLLPVLRRAALGNGVSTDKRGW
ncbi:hypothetical protein [Streptomyces sp. NPDC001165]